MLNAYNPIFISHKNPNQLINIKHILSIQKNQTPQIHIFIEISKLKHFRYLFQHK
jgi:hypothetical protein